MSEDRQGLRPLKPHVSGRHVRHNLSRPLFHFFEPSVFFPLKLKRTRRASAALLFPVLAGLLICLWRSAPAWGIDAAETNDPASGSGVIEEDAYDPALHLPPAALFPPLAPPDYTRGSPERMIVSITFDGGYEAADAPAILDALRVRGIRTTVFLTGLFIERHPEVVRRIVSDGHEVGNHTMSHPHLTDYAANFRHMTLAGVDREMLSRELKAAAALFKDTSGVEMAPLWRAPYGEVNEEIRRWAFDEGYVHVGWTYDYKAREGLDTLDWVFDRSSRLYRTSGEIRDRILGFGSDGSGVRGGIILMHLGTGRAEDRAADVLGEILDSLMDRGYRFVKVTEMLSGSPALEAVEMQRKERVMRSMVSLEAP